MATDAADSMAGYKFKLIELFWLVSWLFGRDRIELESLAKFVRANSIYSDQAHSFEIKQRIILFNLYSPACPRKQILKPHNLAVHSWERVVSLCLFATFLSTKQSQSIHVISSNLQSVLCCA